MSQSKRMFSSISWQEYLISVIIFLILYYGIWMLYFRNDLKVSRPDTRHTIAKESKELFREEEEHALLFSSVHDLMQEIKETFEKAGDGKYRKEGLLMALQAKLVRYKKLKGTAFQVSVNNHIIKESGQLSIEVDEDDLKNMW